MGSIKLWLFYCIDYFKEKKAKRTQPQPDFCCFLPAILFHFIFALIRVEYFPMIRRALWIAFAPFRSLGIHSHPDEYRFTQIHSSSSTLPTYTYTVQTWKSVRTDLTRLFLREIHFWLHQNLILYKNTTHPIILLKKMKRWIWSENSFSLQATSFTLIKSTFFDGSWSKWFTGPKNSVS